MTWMELSKLAGKLLPQESKIEAYRMKIELIKIIVKNEGKITKIAKTLELTCGRTRKLIKNLQLWEFFEHVKFMHKEFPKIGNEAELSRMLRKYYSRRLS